MVLLLRNRCRNCCIPTLQWMDSTVAGAAVDCFHCCRWCHGLCENPDEGPDERDLVSDMEGVSSSENEGSSSAWDGASVSYILQMVSR